MTIEYYKPRISLTFIYVITFYQNFIYWYKP